MKKRQAKLQVQSESQKGKSIKAPQQSEDWEENQTEFSILPPQTQVPVFWKLYCTACLENEIKLSKLERGESITVDHLVTPPNHALIDTYQPSKLGTHVRHVCPKWKEVLCGSQSNEPFDQGSPLLLVITPSSLRAVEYFKELVKLKSNTRVVKLFGRHIKVSQQIESLKKEVRMAVGTPGRVLKLCQQGGLQTTQLKYLFIDTGRDAKKFSMLTTGQLKKDFFLLYHKYVHANVLQGNTKLCFI